MRKWFIGFLWTLLAVVVIGAAVCFWAISEGKIGYMPPIEDLQNPINRYATQVYSSDGKLLGTWSISRENRVMVNYSEIAPSLIQALVATEDARFYEHSGIDFYALGRAIMSESSRWWFYHYTAVGQTALLRDSPFYDGACPAEAH